MEPDERYALVHVVPITYPASVSGYLVYYMSAGQRCGIVWCDTLAEAERQALATRMGSGEQAYITSFTGMYIGHTKDGF